MGSSVAPIDLGGIFVMHLREYDSDIGEWVNSIVGHDTTGDPLWTVSLGYHPWAMVGLPGGVLVVEQGGDADFYGPAGTVLWSIAGEIATYQRFHDASHDDLGRIYILYGIDGANNGTIVRVNRDGSRATFTVSNLEYTSDELSFAVEGDGSQYYLAGWDPYIEARRFEDDGAWYAALEVDTWSRAAPSAMVRRVPGMAGVVVFYGTPSENGSGGRAVTMGIAYFNTPVVAGEWWGGDSPLPVWNRILLDAGGDGGEVYSMAVNTAGVFIGHIPFYFDNGDPVQRDTLNALAPADGAPRWAVTDSELPVPFQLAANDTALVAAYSGGVPD